VHEPELLVLASLVEELGGRGARDAASLEARKHGPPDLQDRLVVPGPLPIPDPPDTLATLLDDDLVLSGFFLLVPGLPLETFSGVSGPPTCSVICGSLSFMRSGRSSVPRGSIRATGRSNVSA
jgi:hypothetical protein